MKYSFQSVIYKKIVQFSVKQKKKKIVQFDNIDRIELILYILKKLLYLSEIDKFQFLSEYLSKSEISLWIEIALENLKISSFDFS